MARRGPAAAALLDDALASHVRGRRECIVRGDALRHAQKESNAAMARMDKKSPEFAARRDELRRTSDEVKELEARQKEHEAAIELALLAIPNTPHEACPPGTSSEDNPVVRTWGEKPDVPAPKPHWDIGTALGILDFDRATKISGPRFAVLLGQAARLERALITFMVDLHAREHGYREIWVPAIVARRTLRGTGQLPKFEQDVFRLVKGASLVAAEAEASEAGAATGEDADLFLSPTAEVQVTNLYGGEILESLPIAFVAYAPCFRSEVGSYGKDVRGLIRRHQFDKVELVRICRPERSMEELELLVGHAETVLKRLGLHHRVVELCAGDLGFAATRTYDIEVWLPGEGAYREISSCSNCTDFQARRASIRFRDDKRNRLVHTLNGSGLAVGRTMVAILEQGLQPDGSVRVPDALVPYFGSDRIVAE